jgi:hypothetical protein
MTEQPLFPPPDDVHEPPVVESKPPRRDLVPWLYGLGFLILAAAIIYLWQYPSVPEETTASASSLHNMEQRISDIDARVSRLEQRPVADVGKITSRVEALESRMGDQSQIASRLDTLSGRIESLAARDQTGMDATKQRIDAVTARIAGLESNTVSLDTITKRLDHFARLQEASFALASGKPVGDMPGAPAALARYAHVAPPTEASLRLSFPSAEQAALAALQPDVRTAPLMDRVWDRAQGLITVRRGDAVVLGNPAATALGHAQTALDAGDLTGAVDAVATLTGQPGEAMAPWLAEAKALLDARSALTQMAGQA